MMLLFPILFALLVVEARSIGPDDGTLTDFKLVWDNGTDFDDYALFGNSESTSGNIGYEFDRRYGHSRYYAESYFTYFTVWVKPKFQLNDNPQFLMETVFASERNPEPKLFQLLIQRNGLGFVVNKTRFDCVTPAWNTWVRLVVKFNMYNLLTKVDIQPSDVKVFRSTIDNIKRWDEMECQWWNSSSNITTHAPDLVQPTFYPPLYPNSNITILGRAFSGEMAHASVFLTSNSESVVKSIVTPKLPFDYIDSSYRVLEWTKDVSLEVNSSVRIEIEHEVTLKHYADISCSDSAMTYTIDPKGFSIKLPTSQRYYGYTRYGHSDYIYMTYYPMNLTVGSHKNCNFTYDSSNYIFTFTTNLTSCGIKLHTLSNGDLIYKSKIFLSSHNATRELMEVSCVYPRVATVYKQVNIEAFMVDKGARRRLHGTAPPAVLNFTLRLFGDEQFTQVEDNPVRLTSTKMLFVEARLDSSVPGISVKIESCITKITLNNSSTLQQTLIDNGSAVNEHVQFYPSVGPNSMRFRFKAMKFEQFPDALVYLNCRLYSTDTR